MCVCVGFGEDGIGRHTLLYTSLLRFILDELLDFALVGVGEAGHVGGGCVECEGHFFFFCFLSFLGGAAAARKRSSSV